MIAYDHRSASILTASALALAFLVVSPGAVRADEAAPPSDPSAVPPTSVVLDDAGHPDVVSTHATTVGGLLIERRIRVAGGDFVSAAVDTPLADGMHLVYRRARVLDIFVGRHKRVVRSSAATIRALLAEQRIAFGPRDEVTPGLGVVPVPYDVIRVTRVDAWTVRERKTIPAPVRERADANLPAGTTHTIDAGATGLRETTLRLVRRDDAVPERIVLASRIIRAPRARVIAKGIAEYSSLASVAERGFASAIRFAGSALHMIATAYTAGCYGCSGITATGMRAGYGIIAVDPRVIPLGTRLFIPGYGRAVAGDTGRAIVGHRVDLGMNTISEALRFGRRPVTVYILR